MSGLCYVYPLICPPDHMSTMGEAYKHDYIVPPRTSDTPRKSRRNEIQHLDVLPALFNDDLSVRVRVGGREIDFVTDIISNYPYMRGVLEKIQAEWSEEAAKSYITRHQIKSQNPLVDFSSYIGKQTVDETDSTTSGGYFTGELSYLPTLRPYDHGISGDGEMDSYPDIVSTQDLYRGSWTKITLAQRLQHHYTHKLFGVDTRYEPKPMVDMDMVNQKDAVRFRYFEYLDQFQSDRTPEQLGETGATAGINSLPSDTYYRMEYLTVNKSDTWLVAHSKLPGNAAGEFVPPGMGDPTQRRLNFSDISIGPVTSHGGGSEDEIDSAFASAHREIGGVGHDDTTEPGIAPLEQGLAGLSRHVLSPGGMSGQPDSDDIDSAFARASDEINAIGIGDGSGFEQLQQRLDRLSGQMHQQLNTFLGDSHYDILQIPEKTRLKYISYWPERDLVLCYCPDKTSKGIRNSRNITGVLERINIPEDTSNLPTYLRQNVARSFYVYLPRKVVSATVLDLEGGNLTQLGLDDPIWGVEAFYEKYSIPPAWLSGITSVGARELWGNPVTDGGQVRRCAKLQAKLQPNGITRCMGWNLSQIHQAIQLSGIPIQPKTFQKTSDGIGKYLKYVKDTLSGPRNDPELSYTYRKSVNLHKLLSDGIRFVRPYSSARVSTVASKLQKLGIKDYQTTTIAYPKYFQFKAELDLIPNLTSTINVVDSGDSESHRSQNSWKYKMIPFDTLRQNKLTFFLPTPSQKEKHLYFSRPVTTGSYYCWWLLMALDTKKYLANLAASNVGLQVLESQVERVRLQQRLGQLTIRAGRKERLKRRSWLTSNLLDKITNEVTQLERWQVECGEAHKSVTSETIPYLIGRVLEKSKTYGNPAIKLAETDITELISIPTQSGQSKSERRQRRELCALLGILSNREAMTDEDRATHIGRLFPEGSKGS